MPTKMDKVLADLGMSDPVDAQLVITRDAISFAVARSMFRLITNFSPEVSKDPFIGYYTFRWVEKTQTTGDVTLEMSVQPSGLKRLPYTDNGTQEIDIQVDAFQLFALAFECITDHLYCEYPTTDDNTQTSGPTVFYNDDVFLKLNIPGVK